MFLKAKSSQDSNGPKDKERPTSNGKTGKKGFSILGSSLKIQGDVIAGEMLHLDGTLEGNLTCDTLVVGAQGRLRGTLHAREARIGGRVEGSLHVYKLIADAGASITGELYYTELIVAAGAQVEGSLKASDAVDEDSAVEKSATRLFKTVS